MHPTCLTICDKTMKDWLIEEFVVLCLYAFMQSIACMLSFPSSAFKNPHPLTSRGCGLQMSIDVGIEMSGTWISKSQTLLYCK